MVSTAKRNRRRARREHQVDPGEEEDTVIAFRPIVRTETRDSPPMPQLFLCGDTVWGCDGHGPETRQRDGFDQKGVQKTPLR